MAHFRKRLLSLITALGVTAAGFSAAPPAAQAVTPPVPDVRYVALGDSIATGYGLSGYAAQPGQPPAATPDGAYVSIVKQNIGANSFANLAVDGMDSASLLTELNTATTGSTAYQALSDANVITLSIGSNDALGPFIQVVAQALGVTITQGESEADILSAIQTAIVQNPAAAASLGTALQSPAAISTFSAAVASFQANFPQIISKIRDIAGDPKIYVTNLYNPFLGISIGALNVGSYAETYIGAINSTISTAIAGGTGYVVPVDVHAAFETAYDGGAAGAGALVNAQTGTTLDPHPTAAGHARIAQLVDEKAQPFTVTGGTPGTDYVLDPADSTPSVTFVNPGTYTVSTPAGSKGKIKVLGGTAGDPVNITLNGVDIQDTYCGFDAVQGSYVNLTLEGANALTGNNVSYPGVRCQSGATLNIGGTGSLAATGPEAGIAGILDNGAMTISGATIKAADGAGVVGSGTLTITGGSLSAPDNIVTTKNADGRLVYPTAVTLENGAPAADAAVSSLTVTLNGSAYSYGVAGVKTDDAGKVCLYLPAGAVTTAAAVGTTPYHGFVTTTADPATSRGVLTTGAIAPNPASLDFGIYSTGYGQDDVHTQTVTITNFSGSSVTLDQPAGAADYTVGALSATTLAPDGGTATFTVQPKTGLAAGTYDETVTVRTAGGQSSSATVGLRFTVTSNPGPDAPSGLTAYPGDGKVFLTWTPSGSDDAAGYRVFAKTAGGDYQPVAEVQYPRGFSTIVPGLTNGTAYTFVVQTVSGDAGSSTNSNTVTATPSSDTSGFAAMSQSAYAAWFPGGTTMLEQTFGSNDGRSQDDAGTLGTAPGATYSYQFSTNPADDLYEDPDDVSTGWSVDDLTITFTGTLPKSIRLGVVVMDYSLGNGAYAPDTPVSILANGRLYTYTTKDSFDGNSLVITDPNGISGITLAGQDDNQSLYSGISYIELPSVNLDPTVTGVTVSPADAAVQKGGTLAFSAAVNGSSSQGVTWSVAGGGAGTTISDTGVLTVAAGETAAALTVKATSTANSTKSGTATVAVTASAPPAATVTGVTVTPSAKTVQQGGTQQFSAVVDGANSPAQTVTWKVAGKTSSGTTISDAGLLTVGADETAATLTVTAASTADSTKSGTAIVSVTSQNPPSPEKTLTGIAMQAQPAKVNYIAGQSLDLAGATVKLSYSDGTSSVIPLEPSMVSAFDSAKTGRKTLTVTYEGKTAVFEVNVMPAVVHNSEQTVSADLSGITLPAGVTSATLSVDVIPASGAGSERFAAVQGPLGGDNLTGLALYDLKLLDQNGGPIEPVSGAVKVKIKIPDGMSGDLRVYWYDPDTNKLTNMNAAVEDGYLVFETTHFSAYAIAQPAAASSAPVTNPKSGAGGTMPLVPLALLGCGAAAGILFMKRRKAFRIKRNKM